MHILSHPKIDITALFKMRVKGIVNVNIELREKEIYDFDIKRNS